MDSKLNLAHQPSDAEPGDRTQAKEKKVNVNQERNFANNCFARKLISENLYTSLWNGKLLRDVTLIPVNNGTIPRKKTPTTNDIISNDCRLQFSIISDRSLFSLNVARSWMQNG